VKGRNHDLFYVVTHNMPGCTEGNHKKLTPVKKGFNQYSILSLAFLNII
jgi:hypothetical protein